VEPEGEDGQKYILLATPKLSADPKKNEEGKEEGDIRVRGWTRLG